MIGFYIFIHLQRPRGMQHCLIKHYNIYNFFSVEGGWVYDVCFNKIAFLFCIE